MMKALGIILAGGGSSRLGDLSKKRAVAAMPIAGSYRCIDFALSSMSNSHVQKVAVFTQYNARSLNQHLSSSKWWDFGRKQGGLFLLTPTVTTTNDSWFRGTADAMCQNIDFLRDSHEPYVVISSGDCVYKADLGKMLQYHIDKNADITIAYTQIDNTLDNPARFGVLTLDKDNKILSLDEKPAEASGNIVNTGIYIMRRRFLIELLNRADKEGRYNLVQDIIVPLIGTRNVYGYELPGYWSNIATVDAYYRTNMDFLKQDMREYFFGGYNSIYSKETDEPPAKFNEGASVRNSLIASGCLINGAVENSVLCRKVYLGSTSVVRNSVILGDVYISDNTVVENCIVESRGTLRSARQYKGTDGKIRVVVESNERYLI